MTDTSARLINLESAVNTLTRDVATVKAYMTVLGAAAGILATVAASAFIYILIK